MAETCGAGVDHEAWKEHFGHLRCEREPNHDGRPHYTSQDGGHYWHGGAIGHHEAFVLEAMARAAARRNSPEAKLERAMRGEW